ncbi:hypothetical protein ACJMK2_039725 [Sinanodonta woodiana]|uniref:DOMON domain-containing protein n=1 Tax=Sinanodonta woodiana TaxID=1069815 RepID=A0ABD3WGB6_SINWO
MERQPIVTFTFICCLAYARGFVGVTPTEPFIYSTAVDNDGNYLLFWNFNETHITFEVHVKTHGYVGFGLSDNSNMYPADVVVGWVKNGSTHFKDYHTTGHVPPTVDKHQDWFLLHGEENDFGTVLKFVRKLDTCDKAEDKKIEDGTIRLIYSYHSNDPASDDSIMYHGPERRGTKSLSLLSVSSLSLAGSTAVLDNIRTIDFLNGNFLLPSATTTYHCRVFKMPDIGGKHHMIKVEPVITPGNEKLVHHILIYRCSGIDPKFVGADYLCYEDLPTDLNPCYDVTFAWAIGSDAFYYPNNVGVSVGAPEDPVYYITETHYDNPSQRSDVIDNSGLRITLTRNLRQYDAGMMEIGHEVNWRQFIPPFEKAYLSQSACSSQCIDHAMGNLHEVKIFGILQHAHLLGRAITTRHFRNGTELSPIATDSTYDFNFQEVRLLRNERSVQRGDSFMVECTYDSTTRTAPTTGGLSTTEEMCLSFVMYYPRIPLTICRSAPVYDSISIDERAVYITLYHYNWALPTDRQRFKQKVKESSTFYHCEGAQMNPTELNFVFHEDRIQQGYSPPSSTCP